MVVALNPAADWRRDGCGDTCALRMVLMPGLVGRQSIVVHDPDAHELYGRMLAGDVAARLVLESGPLVLWRRELLLWVDGQEVLLTPTEWRLFLAILDGNGALVRQSAILVRVWGEAYLGDGRLPRVNLARLRPKLGRAAGLIETIYGVGYRFRFVPPGEAVVPPNGPGGRPLASGEWSLHYSACQRCKTTDRQHQARGYCPPCYRRMHKAGAFDSGSSLAAIAHQEATS